MSPDLDKAAAAAAPAAPAKSARELESLRHLTMVSYLLNASGFLFGITWFIATALLYVKRADAQGTLYASHFTWQIRTFWWALLWALAGASVLFVGVGTGRDAAGAEIFAGAGLLLLWVGYVLQLAGYAMVALYVWAVYRVIKGFIYWSNEKPMKV